MFELKLSGLQRLFIVERLVLNVGIKAHIIYLNLLIENSKNLFIID